MMASNSSKVSHLYSASEKLSDKIKELKVKLHDNNVQKRDRKQRGVLQHIMDWFRS